MASMKFGAQWSVKGLRPEAAETAREAARRSGMSLSDWLNSVILHTAAQQGVDSDEGGEDVAAVHAKLDNLSRRIDQLTRRGPEAYAPPHHRPAAFAPPAPPVYAPPPAAYAPPPPAYAPPSPPMFAPHPHAAPQPSNLGNRLENAVAEIAARRRALNGEPAPQPAPVVQAPAPALAPAPAPVFAPAVEQPPAILRTPTPAQDLSGLEDQLRHITDQIETLRTPGIEEAIHALRGELVEIANSLNEAQPRQAIETIERQIQSLATRIAEGRQSGADDGALGNIERGLAEVRDALYQLTPAENLAGVGEVIHGLDQKIDYIVAQKDPATLQQLEESIVTLRHVAEHIASNDAVGRIASDVAMLAEKIDRLAYAGSTNDALTGLEQRIAALSDAIAARSQNGAAVPPKLEALVDSLSDKIEKLQGSRGDNVAFGHLEDRIVKLVEKLDASDSRLTHLEAIERGLGDLLVHIEEMRAQKPSSGLRENGNGAVDALKQDIARTQNEIQAVHGTLGQVVDRLAMIERGILSGGQAAQPTRPADDAPMQMPGKLAVRAVAAEPLELTPVQQRESNFQDDFAPSIPSPPLAAAEPAPPVVEARPAPAPQRPQPPAAPPQPAKRPMMPRATSLPIDPDLPPDLPLEPGSGPPRVRLDPAARIAASEAALGNARPTATDAPQGKSGFIAAARRAAQAALKDTSTRTPAAQSLPVDLEGNTPAVHGSLRERLGRRVKSLFISASVIAIVVGGFQIASTQFNLFQANDRPNQQSKVAPVQTPDEDDVTHTATTPAPTPAPAVNPQASPFGFLGPTGPALTSPSLTSPQSLTTGDITGSVSSARPQTNMPVPAITAPQAVPTEQVPAAIGTAKLRDAAQAGDAGAAYEIAVRYAEGRGVPANLPEAARWFGRAAQTGLAMAQFRLGSLYEKGQGVKKDLEKAKQNYLAAAAQGNGKAMHNLAVLYAEGLDSKPDFGTASKWFQKASARGIADSQYNLAVLYARGLGVEKNLSESYKWFALAAAQGDKEAASKRDDVATQLDAKDLAAAKQAIKAWTAVAQPAAATTVPQPAGGWDADAAPAASHAPKARASHAPLKIGQR
jgi:localization factor PodJL